MAVSPNGKWKLRVAICPTELVVVPHDQDFSPDRRHLQVHKAQWSPTGKFIVSRCAALLNRRLNNRIEGPYTIWSSSHPRRSGDVLRIKFTTSSLRWSPCDKYLAVNVKDSAWVYEMDAACPAQSRLVYTLRPGRCPTRPVTWITHSEFVVHHTKLEEGSDQFEPVHETVSLNPMFGDRDRILLPPRCCSKCPPTHMVRVVPMPDATCVVSNRHMHIFTRHHGVRTVQFGTKGERPIVCSPCGRWLITKLNHWNNRTVEIFVRSAPDWRRSGVLMPKHKLETDVSSLVHFDDDSEDLVHFVHLNSHTTWDLRSQTWLNRVRVAVMSW